MKSGVYMSAVVFELACLRKISKQQQTITSEVSE